MRRRAILWFLAGAAIAASLLYGSSTILRWACEDRCLDDEWACVDAGKRNCASKAMTCLGACR